MTISVNSPSSFTTPPRYTYIVSFGDATQNGSGRLNSQGRGVINFTIPSDTQATQGTVSVTVNYLGQSVPFSRTIVLAAPEEVVIDFYPETYSYCYGVPNKVYFQAFTNAERTIAADVTNSSLISVAQGEQGGQNETVTLIENLRSESLGRGYFEITPTQGNAYFVSLGENNTQVPLNISEDQVDIENQELQFSVVRKVLSNDEDLTVRIFTNDRMDPSDVYVLGLYVKERALFLEQLSFQPSKSYQMTIQQEDFNLTNGGVLRLQILRVIRPLIWYERFAFLSQGVQRAPYQQLFPISESNETAAGRDNTTQNETARQ